MMNSIIAYFDEKLAQHGPTAKGVDWNSQESQEKRFAILTQLIGGIEKGSSVLDYGCGYGALLPFLRSSGWQGEYIGYDLSEKMLTEAQRLFEAQPRCRFTAKGPLPECDVVIASGLFNMKREIEGLVWRTYIEGSLLQMGALAKRCLVFNMLTSYSDAEKMRSDLYYADPLLWFDFCKRNVSPYVALFHDYPLWEFTLVVKKSIRGGV